MDSVLTDEQLVHECQQGNDVAFDSLMLRHQDKIISVIKAHAPNPGQELDIAQETFLKAYEALPEFRGDSTFYTWLFRIAANTAKNYLATMSRRPAEIDIHNLDQYEGTDNLYEKDTPEDILLCNEVRAIMESAIEELPADQRQAFLLRELDGLSYKEIADRFDCPVGTIRSRIYRARGAVNKSIEQ